MNIPCCQKGNHHYLAAGTGQQAPEEANELEHQAHIEVRHMWRQHRFMQSVRARGPPVWSVCRRVAIHKGEPGLMPHPAATVRSTPAGLRGLFPQSGGRDLRGPV